MCTVTWVAEGGGYRLLFNRDERRSRAEALPPRRQHAPNGTAFIAATDPEGGGTWLGVNAWGLTLGLLNHYTADAAMPARRAPGRPVSRGRLVQQLIGTPRIDDLEAAIARALGSQDFRPFSLLAVGLAPGLRAQTFTWDGERLDIDRAAMAPISSSAFDTARVLKSREQRYAEMLGASPSGAGLEAYHRSHLPERGAASVCMHRPEARTVSLSIVEVGPDSVSYRYGPGPACRAELGRALRLARLAASEGA